jgi:DNA-binding LytR/AlgR family response regulator
MYKCIVIDDEELARTLLISYIKKLDFLELMGAFENPLEAISTLKNNAIDLVFLDIQMPELKGTDFAKMIPANTKVIFTTAYSEYALEGFDLNALDYLLKPITFERFLIAVNKLKNEITTVEKTITVKSGYELHKLKLDEIVYIESDSEYVNFHTSTKKIMSHQTLKALANSLDSSIFMRVHRSFVINKNKVTGLKGKEIIVSDVKIPVSDRYFELVKQLFK